MTTIIPTHSQFAFSGIFPALVTPMTERDEVDCNTLGSFVDHLVAQGVHGLIPLGSTGEYYALSDAERERVIRCTLDAAAGRVPVVAGTNAGSTADVIRYSRQAEQIGCAGVMLAAPYYSLPTEDELYSHFQAIDRQIGLPIMLYNYPGRTGVDMRPEFIARLSELKNVGYVKESTGDATRVSELIRRCGERIGVFCGCDTLALESFAAGSIGWVGGVVNVIPSAHGQLFAAAVVKGDYAQARNVFYQMLPLLSLIEGGGRYTQFVKAACGLLGHQVGPPRAPLTAPSDGEIAMLREALQPWL